MINKIKQKIYKFLHQSEKYTKTDMVYLAKGGFWLTSGQAISSIASFLLAIAFANLLPKETYGEYKYILSIAALLSIPTLKGMETALVQAVARGYEGSIIPALKTKIKWGTFGALAGLILAGYYFHQDNITLTITFLIASVFTPLMDTLNTYEAFFYGKKLFKESTQFNIAVKILATAAMLTTILFTNNIFLIIFTYFVSYTILRLFVLLLVIAKHKFNPLQHPQTLSYGKHLSLVGVLDTIADQLDKLLLWHFLGAVPLAVYSFATAPPIEIRKIFKNIVPLAFPKIAQREVKEIKKTLPAKMLKFFIVLIPLVLIYILLAPYIYKLFFPQYIESVFYSQIFILVLLFQPSTLINTTFAAYAHKKKIYILSITTSIIRISLFLILLPFYGILGAIFAILCTRFISFFMLLFLFKRL